MGVLLLLLYSRCSPLAVLLSCSSTTAGHATDQTGRLGLGRRPQSARLVDDVVREVLDRLRLGTASGDRLTTPVDSDVPGSKLVLHGPHGRSTTSSVACRHVSRAGLFGRRHSLSQPPSRLCQPSSVLQGSQIPSHPAHRWSFD